jgi:hypothetical protein
MEVAAEAFASNKRRNAIEKSCADPALFQNEGPLDLNKDHVVLAPGQAGSQRYVGSP